MLNSAVSEATSEATDEATDDATDEANDDSDTPILTNVSSETHGERESYAQLGCVLRGSPMLNSAVSLETLCMRPTRRPTMRPTRRTTILRRKF